jgi:FAD/FMN-containing dehydrogenase
MASWRAVKLPTRRGLLVGLGIGVPALVGARAATRLGLAAWRERGEVAPVPDGFADDVGRFEQTPIAERVAIGSADPVAQIRDAFARARAQQRPISIAGARHSMGGHTLTQDAIVLDMLGCNALLLDEQGRLHAGAGARWSAVVAFLASHGKAPWVMQANTDFTLGGTLGANAHGWQHDKPPFVSTVQSLRIVTADGELRECSRTTNADLFALVAGGYGLFGVVVDMTLDVVADEVYRSETIECTAAAYPEVFATRTESPDVRMAYGRLSLDEHRLFTHAVFTTFTRVPGAAIEPADRSEAAWLVRAVFRAQIGSDYGKRLRWDLERWWGSEAGDRVARSAILSHSVAGFVNRQQSRTDILHEYFVPHRSFAAFLVAIRRIFPRHAVDLLNVTIRSVERDDDSLLRYATERMLALVMLFSVEHTGAADEALADLHLELVDAVLAVGGTYYLPYRPHATQAQFLRAYPQAPDFFAGKRRWDPDLLLRNRFFERYDTG